MYAALKRFFVGLPIATTEQEHQRLPKTVALATFSSDPISSTAYATEEILFVTAVAHTGSSLALGLDVLVPMAVAVAILLTVVVTSYRQTIHAYPKGGGAYVVSRENLGRTPSLVAGASLLVDYILTVAVSVSAGVAAILSLPTFHDWVDYRVLMCLGFVLLLTVGNLRGLKESGKLFAAPTYLYITSLAILVGWGLYQSYVNHIGPVEIPRLSEEIERSGGTLGLFLILKGFSSGAVALSGIEALADGVPAFRKPEARNAAFTLTVMALILGTLFFGVSLLSSRLAPWPTHEETVISQLGRTVFGTGLFHTVLQFATAGILVLAANTAYADFPRLSSIIARDGFLPRQFANRGDRLVFSNGVVFLAVMASILLIAFGGITTALIALYAVGVFTSFTLSQAGMVMHHRRLKEPGWKRNMVINGFGTLITFTVVMIVSVTKFTAGAWLPIIVVPSIVVLLSAIKRHYERVGRALAITPEQVRREDLNHTVVVLVGRIHKGVIKAIDYAKSLRPHHLVALYVSYEDEDREAMERQWEDFGIDIPLEVVLSKYRELIKPVEDFIDSLDDRWQNDSITVVIPEFVVGRWYEHVLHNQSALFLKGKLLFREGIVVTSVPYHVDAEATVQPPAIPHP